MSARQAPSDPGLHGTLVWERPEPARRSTPEPLSRERIVRAALGIADAEGLAAVSLRNVGAALNAGPMRLYGYVATKEELLDLMVDAVYGEIVPARAPRGDWRKALRAMAQRIRRAADEHPWFIDLLGGRPHIGPNALAHMEASLASLAGPQGFEDVDAMMQAVATVNAYVLGALRAQKSERQAEIESGMDERQWQLATSPYIHRVLASGRYPLLERVVREASHPSPEIVFDRGLECVLDGIAARR